MNQPDNEDEPDLLADEFTHKDAIVNGVRLHYVEAGSGPLMLFVHGFPEFWYTWRHQLRAFRQAYRVVAPDMRGYNLSDKPPRVEQYAAPILVADLKALIEHLGARETILVAHDWGGAVAWAFAIAHPEMLKKLVIINAPHPIPFIRELRDNPEQRAASQYMRAFRDPSAEAHFAADDFAALWQRSYGPLQAQGLISPEDRKAYLAAWSRPGALTGGFNWYRATPLVPPTMEDGGERLPRLDPALFSVKVPTLVIWGMQDKALLPGNLQGLAALIPDLCVVEVPDASHWIVEEQPERVNREIAAFIAR